MTDPQQLNQIGAPYLPGLMGIHIRQLAPGEVQAEIAVRQELMAPNGFLHAASVIALADTAAGYGCVANLPEGASGFMTVELKSNHLGTATEGTIECIARPAHLGKATHVWDATVTHRESGRTLALFRCTQMVLYAKQGA